jgi:ABC-type uncharacterized transport system involved in gliding motility auxiliary subunit
MNKKRIESILFSTAGVAAMFLILVAVNFLGSIAKARIDLTEDQLYTLSDGTKTILDRLEAPVEIRFYCTRDENHMPVPLRNYARRVEDLLDEFRQHGQGNIVIKKFNPEPDSDAEDKARLDGVEGQMVQTGDSIYLGIAVSFLDKTIALPFLTPARETLLEYDLSRALSSVLVDEKPTIGILSSMPIMGGMDPMAMRMGQMNRQEPWVFVSELRRDFDVQEVSPGAEKIDDKIKVLLLVHPKDLSDVTQYAIDQFVLRGGKLIAFLDPQAIMDRSGNPQFPGLTAASNLDKLLKAWGIEFDTGKVVADMNYATQLRMGQGARAQNVASFLNLTREAINTNDVATSQIDSVMLPFPGAFTGTPATGLTKTVLIHSTENSQMVDRMIAQMSPDQIIKDFKSEGSEKALAIKLTGRFRTAFPDGKPKAATGDETRPDELPPAPDLTEGKSENAVILVADADMLYDQFSVQVQNFFGQRIMIPMNGNLSLVQNFVEQFAGDEALISMRSRATQNRPFTVVNKMRADAESRYQEAIKKLEEEQQETQRKLNELQQNKDKSQRFILSPEQQEEIRKLQEKAVEVNKQLKEERKKLRKDIDALQTKVKWANIAGMPALVTLAGLILAVLKRRRTAAR